MKIAVLGGGAVAQALNRALSPQLRWRRPKPLPDLSGCDVILLAVSDAAIEPLCAKLAVREGQLVAHLAGALGLAPLASAAANGARTGSLHPLRAFVRGKRSTFRGASAGITGSDDEAVKTLERLARKLRMKPLHVPDQRRALYHAAAVLSAGAQVALFAEAVRAFREATGSSEPEARAALLPLTLGALEKLSAAPPESVITGPAVRGDVATVLANRAALPKGLHPLYDALIRTSVTLALEGERADPAALHAVLDALP